MEIQSLVTAYNDVCDNFLNMAEERYGDIICHLKSYLVHAKEDDFAAHTVHLS